MSKIWETQRLLARNFEVVDAEAFYRLNNDVEVMKFTGDAPFASVSEALEFIKNYDAYKKHGFGRWAIVEKQSGAFVGFCGLKRNEELLVDVGFRFFKSHWGKGFATESALATLKFGFEKLSLPMIIGRAIKENVRSVRVLEKCGMRYWKDGPCAGLDNAAYYKILRADWLRENSQHSGMK